MVFGNFWNILWVPILIPPLLWIYFRGRRRGQVRFSSLASLKRVPSSASPWIRHLLILLRVAALILLILALMRPREGTQRTRIATEGVDIVLALDVSGSMNAEDFSSGGARRNRLYVVKEVVREFIQKRPDDRIGVVIFAGRAYTLCPLTLDRGVLFQFLDRARVGMLEDGTAIGDGVTTSLNRLRKLKSKSKIIILLTDGAENAGKVNAKTAAELARSVGVKVYTIGVGSKGPVPFPARDAFGRVVYQLVQIDLDEGLLRTVAERTGGAYYRATDTERLKDIYATIDQLEKTKIETNLYVQYRELFGPYVFSAMMLVLAEIVLGQTWLRTLP